MLQRLHVMRIPLYSLRSIHTTAAISSERGGIFGKLNPWAKPTSLPEPAPTSTPTQSTTIPPIAPTFDVTFEEEKALPLWRNADIMVDANTIESTVRDVVLEHLPSTASDQWKDAVLDDPDVKFKIVKESIKIIGKEVPNLELNNMASAGDLVAFMQQRDPDPTRPVIKAFFEDHANDLPPNLTFEPSHKAKP